MALQNARIDQLPQNGQIPSLAYVAIMNMDNTITERLELSKILPTITSQNFEWVVTNEYGIDEVVTYSGKWYQSLITANEGNVPGIDILIWEEINVNTGGGIPIWESGFYVADEVIVAKAIDDEMYLFRLSIDESRPFESIDFEVELAAVKWKQIGGPETREVNTAPSTINFNCAGIKELLLIGNAPIDENKTFSFTNAFPNTLRLPFIKFLITDTPVTFTFDASFKMSDPKWNNVTWEWTTEEDGIYIMSLTFDWINMQHIVTINGPFI